MRRLAQIEGVLARAEAILVSLVMAVMFVAGVAQVVIRTSGMRSAGTGEVTTLLMAVLAFGGAGLIIYTADNVAIEVLDYVHNARVRRLARLVGVLALVLFAVIFGYHAWNFANQVGSERTLQLGLPLIISAGAMVVGAVLMFVHAVSSGIRLLLGEPPDPHRDRLRINESAAVE